MTPIVSLLPPLRLQPVPNATRCSGLYAQATSAGSGTQRHEIERASVAITRVRLMKIGAAIVRSVLPVRILLASQHPLRHINAKVIFFLLNVPGIDHVKSSGFKRRDISSCYDEVMRCRSCGNIAIRHCDRFAS